MSTSVLASHINFQWLTQQFGFHNSPSIFNNQTRDWFNATATVTNKNAWLDVMEAPLGGGNDNSPIAVSYANSNESTCLAVHNARRMKSATVQTPRTGGPACAGDPPSFWYCYTLNNNGGC